MKQKLKSYKFITICVAMLILLVSFVLSAFKVDVPISYIATIISIVLSFLIMIGLVDKDLPKTITSETIKDDILSTIETLKGAQSNSDKDKTLVDNQTIENDKEKE